MLKLNEKTVRRESKINSGDIYNISKIEQTQTRIFSSLLFSSVEVLPHIRDEISDTYCEFDVLAISNK